ncbi:SocA family protein [Vibrio cholerae]|uniref:Panacea domain-containing protein n=1 Tax=Vibrio cholerae TaxID=666 RepID=UPI0018F05DA0|nr:Panacea domain-containing protein [Vibrio cholerae]MBJ6915170.1 SocA family protein [Vibrio cholerae]MBJ6918932.1 SocA family protein [Vibrio cholerae]
MNKLREIVRFLVSHYPHKKELSKARLTKMVYIADWKCALTYGYQLTDIRWQFNHYGPYVDEVIDTAYEDPEIDVVSTTNMYGHPKVLINSRLHRNNFMLSQGEINILLHVIDETANMYWDEFIKYVYSSYPIASQNRYSELDLPKLAQQYHSLQRT